MGISFDFGYAWKKFAISVKATVVSVSNLLNIFVLKIASKDKKNVLKSIIEIIFLHKKRVVVYYFRILLCPET